MSARIDPETLTVYCTQGDTFETKVNIYVGEGSEVEPYVPDEGDVIRFAVKSRYTDPEPIIRKVIPNDTLVLRLEADETKLLEARKKAYVYDIELTTPNGYRDTFIKEKEWYSTWEVD